MTIDAENGPPYHLATLLKWTNMTERGVATAAGFTSGHLAQLKKGDISKFDSNYANQLLAVLNLVLWESPTPDNRQLTRPLLRTDIIELQNIRDLPDPNADRASMSKQEWANYRRRLNRFKRQQAGEIKPRGRPKKADNTVPTPKLSPLDDFFNLFQLSKIEARPKPEVALLLAALIQAERLRDITYTATGFEVTPLEPSDTLPTPKITLKEEAGLLILTYSSTHTNQVLEFSRIELEILTLLLIKQFATSS